MTPSSHSIALMGWWKEQIKNLPIHLMSFLDPRKTICPCNADLLAEPIKEILNKSYHRCCLLNQWKEADTVVVPKHRPILDTNKLLNPFYWLPCHQTLGRLFLLGAESYKNFCTIVCHMVIHSQYRFQHFNSQYILLVLSGDDIKQGRLLD